MTTCAVRWRPSGGRGEFEFVPSDSLRDREIYVDFEAISVQIPAEVRGVHAQGKPRLRKFEKNNRRKLHLPQLVMAVVGLPEPARSNHLHSVEFPLENKAFVMDEMVFDVIGDDGLVVVLAPLRVSILHCNVQINMSDRLNAIAQDLHLIHIVRRYDVDLAEALEAHAAVVKRGVNSIEIRETADNMINLKSKLFGQTNSGSAMKLIEAVDKPEVEAEKIVGREGRLLTRLHFYKERDRSFAQRVRDYFKHQWGGQLVCEACGCAPTKVYGQVGDSCIEVHHKVPIEQLQPDSVTVLDDMAIVCANCHRVVHSKKPCLTVNEVIELIEDR